MARVERGLEEAVYEGMAWGCLVSTEQGVLVLALFEAGRVQMGSKSLFIFVWSMVCILSGTSREHGF